MREWGRRGRCVDPLHPALLLSAGALLPWSPQTHRLWPRVFRRSGVALLLVGRRLSMASRAWNEVRVAAGDDFVRRALLLAGTLPPRAVLQVERAARRVCLEGRRSAWRARYVRRE